MVVEHRDNLKQAVVAAKASVNNKERRTIVGHLACYQGRIIEKRWEEEDLEATTICFHNPSVDLHCHHVTVRTVDENVGLIVRNMRTQPIGKKLLITFMIITLTSSFLLQIRRAFLPRSDFANISLHTIITVKTSLSLRTPQSAFKRPRECPNRPSRGQPLNPPTISSQVEMTPSGGRERER